MKISELLRVEERQWIEICYKGKRAGEILIEARLIKSSMLRNGEKKLSRMENSENEGL